MEDNFKNFTGQVERNLKQELLQNLDPKSLSFAVFPSLFRTSLNNYNLTKISLRVFGETDWPDNLKLQIPDVAKEIELIKHNDGLYEFKGCQDNYDIAAQNWFLSSDKEFFNPQNIKDIALIVAYDGKIDWYK